MLRPEFDHYIGQSVTEVKNGSRTSWLELESGVRFAFQPGDLVKLPERLKTTIFVSISKGEQTVFGLMQKDRTSFVENIRVSQEVDSLISDVKYDDGNYYNPLTGHSSSMSRGNEA